MIADWTFPTQIILGNGRVSALEGWLQNNNLHSLMIITDHKLTTTTIFKKFLHHIDKMSIAFGVFSDLNGRADKDVLARSVGLFQDGGFDSIIAFGGGSVIDLAKLTALVLVKKEAPSYVYHTSHISQKPPVIVIPTLAGSGTEIQETVYLKSDIITNEQKISDERLKPSLVIYDSALTSKAPSSLAAGAGMNAFVNAIDSWFTPEFNPPADALAIETIQLILKYLPITIHDPNNIEAQMHIQTASICGAMAATKGIGPTAALAYAISHYYDTQFDVTAAVLLPHVLAYYQSSNQERLELLNEKLSIKKGFNGLANILLELRQSIGIPSKLNRLAKGQKIKLKDKAFMNKRTLQLMNSQGPGIRLTKKAVSEILHAAIIGKIKRNNRTITPLSE
ncbi:iron-containing alcohol dehydrogenase [Bartonella tamiae]|uniref:Uncharacterized protein n=1 Tax=Bartonella tamiae Th239 TaxID=1094558 RepID=J1JWE2_9HYPH|nr:iron-containing alcohol dehydrogenase [Bartonella tamiae]EJF89332.1 hypothetical protein ME5_01883 [Bartonella tamiae Th239]EJF92803.1 hypothetical protein MEG_01973 [Bartonella tamiae Th307]